MICPVQLSLQNGRSSLTLNLTLSDKRMLCRTYAAFLEHVSAGRNMDIAKVRRLARGRVWSGQAWPQHGLVDGLGGLSDAITTAKQLAKLPQVQFSCAFQHYHMKTSSVR